MPSVSIESSLAHKNLIKERTTLSVMIVAAAVSSVATLVLAGLVAFYACRRPAGRDLEGPVEIKTPPHEETKHSA